jgi:hypothetical protein
MADIVITPPKRGERNKNPLNLNYLAHDPYQGQLGLELVPAGESYKPRFGRYDSIANGLRAGAKQLLADFTRHNLRSMTAICSSWAPLEDGNPTPVYVKGATCSFFNLDPKTVAAADLARYAAAELAMETPATLAGVMRAIIIQENGRCIYGLDQLLDAAAAALQSEGEHAMSDTTSTTTAAAVPPTKPNAEVVNKMQEDLANAVASASPAKPAAPAAIARPITAQGAAAATTSGGLIVVFIAAYCKRHNIDVSQEEYLAAATMLGPSLHIVVRVSLALLRASIRRWIGIDIYNPDA